VGRDEKRGQRTVGGGGREAERRRRREEARRDVGWKRGTRMEQKVSGGGRRERGGR
jgi:hypothetical protein